MPLLVVGTAVVGAQAAAGSGGGLGVEHWMFPAGVSRTGRQGGEEAPGLSSVLLVHLSKS